MTHRRNTPTAKVNGQTKVKSFIKSEWPLFFYPALVVAAIILLQMVGRSIQKDLTPSTHPQPPHPSAARTTPEQSPHEAFPTAAEHEKSMSVPDWVPPSSNTTRALDTDLATDRLSVIEALRDRAEAAGSEAFIPGADESEESQGINGTVAILRRAVRTRDHAQIKQAIDDLVALGDEAVVPLSDLIAGGMDETALWAAEALARIGTPTATAALFDTLSQVNDGLYREQIAKTASNVSNHDSWPLLLDTFQETMDATVQRAAAASLSRMADRPVLDEIIARYDAALTEEEAAHLAQLVRNISSPRASESLRALAGDASASPQDSLQQAAIDALANVADAPSVSFLLSKLEAVPPGEGASLFNTITKINAPQAHSALLYAAAGSKDVSAEHGRTAAIYALENYPTVETCVLLERIAATDDNTAVITAALRTLENIQNTVPSAVEQAISKADSHTPLSLDPLQK